MTWARCRFLICTTSGFSPAVDLLSRLSSLPRLPNWSSGPPVALPVGASPEATQMSTVHVLHLSHVPALPPTLLQKSSSRSPFQHHLVLSLPPHSTSLSLTHTRACPHTHVQCVCHKHLCQDSAVCQRKTTHSGGQRPPPAGPSLLLLPYLSLALFTNPLLQPNWSTGKTLIR